MAAAKSRLLEQFSANGINSRTEEVKSAQEADELRTKLMRILHNDIMDFKRTRVETVLACCETLLKCIRNIADHPDESKYRKIKAANPKWAETVETVVASRDFLLAMGWRIEVVEFARSWVYNATGPKVAIMAAELLEDAVMQLRHKLSLNKTTDKHAEAEAIRERARRDFQEDRRLKREADERAQLNARERAQQAALEKQIAAEKQAELEREAAELMGSGPSSFYRASDKKEH